MYGVTSAYGGPSACLQSMRKAGFMVKNYYSLDREKLRRAKDLMFNDMCHTVYLLKLSRTVTITTITTQYETL